VSKGRNWGNAQPLRSSDVKMSYAPVSIPDIIPKRYIAKTRLMLPSGEGYRTIVEAGTVLDELTEEQVQHLIALGAIESM
jgi:hypothetical protein